MNWILYNVTSCIAVGIFSGTINQILNSVQFSLPNRSLSYRISSPGFPEVLYAIANKYAGNNASLAENVIFQRNIYTENHSYGCHLFTYKQTTTSINISICQEPQIYSDNMISTLGLYNYMEYWQSKLELKITTNPEGHCILQNSSSYLIRSRRTHLDKWCLRHHGVDLSIQCKRGKCCDLTTCFFKKTKEVCRPARDCCDIPEYCTGNSSACPKDLFVHTGEYCSAPRGDGYCHHGMCRTSDTICQSFHKMFFWAKHLCAAGNESTNVTESCKAVYCAIPENLAIPKELEKNVFQSTSSSLKCFYTSVIMDGTKCEFDGVCWGAKCERIQDIRGCECPKIGEICTSNKKCISYRCKKKFQTMIYLLVGFLIAVPIVATFLMLVNYSYGTTGAGGHHQGGGKVIDTNNAAKPQGGAQIWAGSTGKTFYVPKPLTSKNPYGLLKALDPSNPYYLLNLQTAMNPTISSPVNMGGAFMPGPMDNIMRNGGVGGGAMMPSMPAMPAMPMMGGGGFPGMGGGMGAGAMMPFNGLTYHGREGGAAQPLNISSGPGKVINISGSGAGQLMNLTIAKRPESPAFQYPQRQLEWMGNNKTNNFATTNDPKGGGPPGGKNQSSKYTSNNSSNAKAKNKKGCCVPKPKGPKPPNGPNGPQKAGPNGPQQAGPNGPPPNGPNGPAPMGPPPMGPPNGQGAPSAINDGKPKQGFFSKLVNGSDKNNPKDSHWLAQRGQLGQVAANGVDPMYSIPVVFGKNPTGFSSELQHHDTCPLSRVSQERIRCPYHSQMESGSCSSGGESGSRSGHRRFKIPNSNSECTCCTCPDGRNNYSLRVNSRSGKGNNQSFDKIFYLDVGDGADSDSDSSCSSSSESY